MTVSLYGEPNSPERLALVAARKARQVAPRGLERLAAIEAYERARKAAMRAAQRANSRQRNIAPTSAIAGKSGLVSKPNAHDSTDKKRNDFAGSGLGSGGANPHSGSYRLNGVEVGGITHESPALSRAGKSAASALLSDNGAMEGGERTLPTQPTENRAKRRGNRERRAYFLGHPVRESKTQWMAKACAELDSLGLGYTADALALCGRECQTWDCASCGEKNAAIQVNASCGMRICPWCARRDAQKRVARSEPAIDCVPLEFSEMQRWVVLKLETAVRKAERARETHIRRFLQSCHADRKITLACYAMKAEERRQSAQWQLHQARAKGWRWKLLTITGPWAPTAASEYTVQRIKERVKDVQKAFLRVWDRLKIGGLSSALTSVEISEGGHIHLHALVWMPYVQARYIASLAGARVDLQNTDKGGPVEAIKYSVKLVSPSSAQWIAGEHRECIHPVLAARWLVATKNMHLRSVRGATIRAAFKRVASKQEPGEACSSLPRCVICKVDLIGPGVERLTREVAREQFERCEHTIKEQFRRYKQAKIVLAAAGGSSVAAEHLRPTKISKINMRRQAWGSRLQLIDKTARHKKEKSA